MPTFDELIHQVHDHAQSWRAAGVEFLPRPAVLPRTAPSAVAADAVACELPPQPPANSLFDRPVGLPVLDLAEKIAALDALNEQVKPCTKCSELVRNRTQTVFGVGSPMAELCFVGEAPGADEDVQGEPFVGAAGQLLNKIIAACGMKREDVYICNILKCRPPGNRTPLPDEQANCRPFLERQIEIVRPKFLCALGAVAAQGLTGTTSSIGKLRGRLHNYRGIPVLCTYHPAYLLRNPAAKRDVWEDMKFLMAKMGRPVK
jgi:uracil-DNA glycosylase family 4